MHLLVEQRPRALFYYPIMNISILQLIVKSSWKQPSHDLKLGLVLTPGLVMCGILFANNYPQEN